MSERKNPHQFVTVGSSGEEFLTIETNCLSGAPIGEREEQTIRWAIDNLSGFIGGAPPINKPAMPNGSCDCGASSAATMREAAAKMADDAANYDSVGNESHWRGYRAAGADIAAAIRAILLPPDTRDGEIAELRAELARLREANEWRPIESAPTDQKQILVGFMGQFSWYAFVAYALGATTTSSGHAPPTDWRPLPPPPQETSK
jgi:hypothetical protein